MEALPADIATAADYEPFAQARLEPAYWNYLAAGSGLETTLHDNRRAFETIRIVPRLLRGGKGGDTRLSLCGTALEHPVLLAPIAYQALFHSDAEAASVAAADALGGLAVVSSLASQPLASIAQACERPQWFQLYWQGDRSRTLALLQTALAANYAAVILTADAPVKQATLDLPSHISAVNLQRAPAPMPLAPGASEVFDGWMAQAPDWDDLAWLRAQLDVPLLLKGVLHPDDAAQAVALGCDGLVVSNHGGRILDGAPSSLTCLPQILAAVDGRVPVVLDSGIRNGRDVFKALALGASAVMVGRPYIWGLASAGAMGVAHVIRLLRDELEMTMALSGCRTLSEIGAHTLL